MSSSSSTGPSRDRRGTARARPAEVAGVVGAGDRRTRLYQRGLLSELQEPAVTRPIDEQPPQVAARLRRGAGGHLVLVTGRISARPDVLDLDPGSPADL